MTMSKKMMSTLTMMVMIKCKRICEVERQERRIAFSGGRLHRQTICAQLFSTFAKLASSHRCKTSKLSDLEPSAEVPVGEKRDVMKTLIFMWKDAKNKMWQDVALFISFQPLYVVEMGMFSVESFNLNLKQTMCTFFLPILKCSLRLSISYMSSIIFVLYNQ